MVDFVPFPGMASTDNNTQYPANQVMITGNSGTVTATGSMVIVPSTNRIGVGTDNPLGPFDANVNVSFRQGFTTQNTAVVSSLVSNGTITTNAFVANTITSNGTIQAAGTATVNALVSNIFGRFGQNLQVIGSNASINSTTGAFLDAGGAGIAGNLNVGGTVSTFTGAVGIGTTSGVGIATTPYSSNLWIYGNVVLANTSVTSSGVIFPDGTRQTSAAANTPSYGPAGTIQVAGAGNTLTGDGSNFFWDNTNKRLGIGTSTPAYLFSLYGTDYVLFNNRPGAAARQEITVGNVIGYGSVLGYDPSIGQSIGYLRRGDSAATSPAITWAYVSSNYRVGINAITQPQNTMDIAGAVAIGASYSGANVMSNTNGLSVQGLVGIGTFTPFASLDVFANNSTAGATASHVMLRNGTGSQTVTGYQFGGTILATNRVDNSGNWVVNSSSNNFYFNNESINTGTAGTVNFYAGSTNFMSVRTASVLLGATTAPANSSLLTINSATGAGIELLNANSGGGNVSAVSGGGLQFGTFTGAAGAETYNALLTMTKPGSNATGNLLMTGNINATLEITAYFSDVRLKDNIVVIDNALDRVMAINGVFYNPNELAETLVGESRTTNKVGLLAQEVEAVMPHVIKAAPFDTAPDGTSRSGDNYKTIQYDKLVPLLVQAIKEQQAKIDALEARISTLELDPWP